MRTYTTFPSLLGRIPPTIRQAFALFLTSSFVRTMGPLAAIVLAYYTGTGQAMDHYATFSIVMVVTGTLCTSALPAIVSSRITGGPSFEAAAQASRQWACQVRRTALWGYLALCPVLGWLFTPRGAEGIGALTLLLLLGAPVTVLSAPTTVEQVLLQSRGHARLASWSPLISTSMALAGALLGACIGGVHTAVVGISVGCWLEYRWLCWHNRDIPVLALPKEPFPLKTLVTVLGAAGGLQLLTFYDQALLAQMGAGAQATWGLASRIPSYLSLSIFGMASILCSALLTPAHSAGRVVPEAGKLFVVVGGLSLLVMGCAWLAAEPLVWLLFERGAFGPQDTARVSSTMTWTILTYLMYPAVGVLVRAAVLIGGHRTLLTSAGAYVIVKVAVLSLLANRLGVCALGISTVLAGITQIGVLSLHLRRHSLGRHQYPSVEVSTTAVS